MAVVGDVDFYKDEIVYCWLVYSLALQLVSSPLLQNSVADLYMKLRTRNLLTSRSMAVVGDLEFFADTG